MNAPVATHELHALQRPIPEEFLQALAARFGSQYSNSLAVREQHGRDEGSIAAPPPAAVVFAESTQDVQDAVRLCDQYGDLCGKTAGGFWCDTGKIHQNTRLC